MIHVLNGVTLIIGALAIIYFALAALWKLIQIWRWREP